MKRTFMNFILVFSLFFLLFLNFSNVCADSNAPDYYQIRVWQGSSTSASHLIKDWTTVCDTTPSSDSDDYSGGFSCSYNVGSESSPRWCSYEGDYYVQWRFRDENTGSYTYSYTQGGNWVNTFSSSYNGLFIYNINWDNDQNDCECKVGSGHWDLGGDYANPKCCGDDANEYVRTCVGDNEICDVSTDDVACCNVSTDCVYNDVCYTDGQTVEVNGRTYQCDNGYWRGVGAICGVWIDQPKFEVKTSGGNEVVEVDKDGDAWFKCSSLSHSVPPTGMSNTFYVKVDSSYKYAFNNNDCYVPGSINQEASVPSPDGNDFAIKTSGGTYVGLFNDAGNIYVKGYAAYPNSQAACPSGYHCDSSSWKCVK